MSTGVKQLGPEADHVALRLRISGAKPAYVSI